MRIFYKKVLRPFPRLTCLLLFMPTLFLAGCGTFIDELSGNDRIYGGVRTDLEKMLNPPSVKVLPLLPLGVLDLPFSFTLDTLNLAEKGYQGFYDGPSVDPLRDWKRVANGDNFSRRFRLEEVFPFEISVRDDIAAYLSQNVDRDEWSPDTLSLSGSVARISVHEDGQGHRAVRISVAWEKNSRDQRIITLIYDSEGRRTQTLSWRQFHRPSRC